MSSSHVVPFVLALTSIVSAQTTLIVDNSVSPTPGTFSSIQRAVNAALPGDTIQVNYGSNWYQGATVTRGVFIVGVDTPRISGDITFDEIPPGQSAVLTNFLIGGKVECDGCVGSVHLERLDVYGTLASLGGVFDPSVDVNQCVHVSGLDCVFRGNLVLSPFPPGPIGAHGALGVRDSGLHLTRCEAYGIVHESESHPGVEASNSRLVFVDSDIRGGDGTCQELPPSGWVPGTAPTPGLSGLGGNTVVTKGTTFVGGAYGQLCGGAMASGVVLDQVSTIVSHPGTSLDLQGGQLITQPLHDLQTAGAAPGTTFSVTLNAGVPTPMPFATWAALAGQPILHPVSLWLDLTAPVPLFAGTITGSRTDSALVQPQWPAGFPLALQSVLLVNGQLEVSTPVVLIFH